MTAVLAHQKVQKIFSLTEVMEEPYGCNPNYRETQVGVKNATDGMYLSEELSQECGVPSQLRGSGAVAWMVGEIMRGVGWLGRVQEQRGFSAAVAPLSTTHHPRVMTPRAP